MKIGNYEIVEKILRNPSKTIYRVEDAKGQRYILKQLNIDTNQQEEMAKFQKEMQILEQLDPQFVVKCIENGEYEGSSFLLMEDKGGISLKSYLVNKSLNMYEFLQLAVDMTHALNHVHLYNVIHEDVNPSNFIINPETSEIWLNDFGCSEYYQKSARYSGVQTELKGTIEYISPEQTGRINATIDFRTDIYSLGVTFYEMCTGTLPFKANDFLTNIHLHITVVPARPDQISTHVPRQVSNIVMKMLEKEPIGRYQSLFGLLDDLKECQKKLHAYGFIPEFDLGKTDNYCYFNYPTQVYGRINIVNEIQQILRRHVQSTPHFLLIEGESGVGKSYVVSQLLKNQKTHLVLLGEFSEGIENPYSGIIKALRYYFAHQLLGNDEDIEVLTRDLQDGMGSHGSLMLSIIPELRAFIKSDLIIEDQLDVGVAETQFRFHTQIAELIKMIISRDKKMIMVLDDFHHMDDASGFLLEYLLERADLSHFIVIGLAQNIENAPNLQKVHEKCQENLNYKSLTISGYDASNIHVLLHDLFGFDDSQCQVLSDILMSKTRGIPLFVYDVLKQFYVQNIIFFDTELAKWSFHLSGAKKIETAPNVVEYILKRVSVLSEDERRVLLVASCFEMPFNLDMLIQVGELSEEQAINGIIMLVDNEFLDYDNRLNDLIFRAPGYRTHLLSFRHLNIRTVVNKLLNANDLEEYQYRIGIEIYNQYKQQGGVEKIPTIVKYFNVSKASINDRQLALDIAELNYLLAYQARSIAAFDQSQHYISNAVQLLDDSAFELSYDLAFRVFLLKAEIEYLTKFFKRAEADFSYLLKQTKTVYDIARVNKLRLMLYVNQGETGKVVALAIETLGLLGVELKTEGSVFSILHKILYIKTNKVFNEITNLEYLPICLDLRIQLAMEVLMTLISVSYLISKILFIQIILEMIVLSLKFGNVASSSFAYATFGIIEGNLFGKYHRAYQYGELGIRLAKRFKNLDVSSQAHFTMGFFLNHWENHVREALPFVSLGRDQSEKCGDMVYFAYNVAAYHLANTASSTQLDVILDAIEKDLKKINEVQVFDVTNMLISVRQMVLNLKGKTTAYTSFDSPGYDQKLFEQTLKQSNNLSIYAVYLVLKMKTHYIYDYYQESESVFNDGDKLFSNLMGLYQSVEYLFYQVLILLKTNTSDPRISKNIKKLKKYARVAPTNFEHMYLISKAERLRVQRRYDEAKHYFDLALKVCHQNDFLLEEALCCEMVAHIYGQEANVKLRKIYLFEAYALYVRIGAVARLRFMESKYKELVFVSRETAKHDLVNSMASTSIKASSEKFELLSIINASQSIAGVVNENDLIDETLRIVLQISNADRAVLMIKEDQILIRAVAEGLAQIQVFKHEVVKGSGIVPESLVNYALRMEEPIVVNHLESSTAYGKDAYFSKGYVKSVLMMPLLNKDRLVGLMYLENSLISGAFGYNRLESLNVILSQFAISYENARLIENIEQSEAQIRFHKEHLEELVSQRTSELSIAKSDIEAIMNNVDQGFMQFDQTGVVLDGYSKECIKFFGKRIDGLDFDVLFNQGAKKSEESFYKKIILKIFEVENTFSASVYLGLLPEVIVLNQRTIQVSYKLVRNRFYNRIVVIMTDMTDKMRLEFEKEAEKHNLKKIVNIIKYRSNLKKNIEEYKFFFNTGVTTILDQNRLVTDSLKEMYRIVHTFKGDFGQWGMSILADSMHALEENLIQLSQKDAFNAEDLMALMDNFNFEETLEKEFGSVFEYTGRLFLENEDSFQVSKGQMDLMTQKLDAELTAQGKIIWDKFVKHVQYVEAKDMLLQYQEYAINQAALLGKQLSGILINGDAVLLDRDIYYDFFRSLVHIIRNIVQYAIELPDVRIACGKPEEALVTCDIHYTAEGFKLVIADDGGGIDIEKVKEKALALNLVKKDNYTEAELLNVIFLHGFTTASETTGLSGRGVGLSAVKDEVEKLGGSIVVHSIASEGTIFEFIMPLKHDLVINS
jgi:predicted ATPase/signal transduction histidine kinase/tRNA A-37 threonylcarbamoyl transferase component Bud32